MVQMKVVRGIELSTLAANAMDCQISPARPMLAEADEHAALPRLGQRKVLQVGCGEIS